MPFGLTPLGIFHTAVSLMQPVFGVLAQCLLAGLAFQMRWLHGRQTA